MEGVGLWFEFDRATGLVSVKWPTGLGPGNFGPKPWNRALEFARYGAGPGLHQAEVRVLGPVRLPNSSRTVTGVVNRYPIQFRGRQ